MEGLTATMAYDGDHNLVTSTQQSALSGQQTTRYLHDPNLPLSQLLTDGNTTYAYGPGMAAGFGPLMQETSGNRRWLHADALGSVRLATDDSGSATATSSYDAFGAPRLPGGDLGRFGFAGQQSHPDLGLVHMRARWYDPAVGRFLSQDPVSGSASAPQTLNPYAYVANNPCNARDPSGLQAGGGGGGAGGSTGSTATLATPGGTGAGSVATRALGNAIAERPVAADLFGPAGVSSCVMPAPATKATAIVVPQFRLPRRTFGDGTLGGELKSLFAYVAQVLQAAATYLGDLAAFFQNLATQAPAIAGRALLCAAHGIGAALMAEDNGQWRSAPLTLTARDSGRTGLLGLPGSQSAQSSSSPLLASPCIPGAIACPRPLPGISIDMDALKKLLLLLAGALGLHAATREGPPRQPEVQWVVRGGLGTADRFVAGSGVQTDALTHRLWGISVQTFPRTSVAELARFLPHRQIGVRRWTRFAGQEASSSSLQLPAIHITLCWEESQLSKLRSFLDRAFPIQTLLCVEQAAGEKYERVIIYGHTSHPS